MQEAEEHDTCRICSAPAEPNQPLFHPCKCSGTIRYIHQDCLTTWLSHSKKKTCDVCKHPYSFTKVYAEDMPSRLPTLLLSRRLAQQAFFAFLFVVRAIVVFTIWLAVLPWATVWTWRIYFSMGDSIAWWISKRPRPSFPANSNVLINPFYTHIPRTPPPPTQLGTSLLGKLSSHPVWTALSADIFTGQIIASLIVLTFVAVFLLREWISQNARPGVFEDGAPEEPEPVPELPPQPAPLPQQLQQLQQQQQAAEANERRRMAQGQIDAVRALDILRAREGTHGHLVGEGRNHGRTELDIEEMRKVRDRHRQEEHKKRMEIAKARRRAKGRPYTDDVMFSPEEDILGGVLGDGEDSREAFNRRLQIAKIASQRRKGKAAKQLERDGMGLAVENPYLIPSHSGPSAQSVFPQVTLQAYTGDSLPYALNTSSSSSSSPSASASSIRRPPLPVSVPSSPTTPLASPSLATYRPPEEFDGYFEEEQPKAGSSKLDVKDVEEEINEDELQKYFPEALSEESDLTLKDDDEEEIEEISADDGVVFDVNGTDEAALPVDNAPAAAPNGAFPDGAEEETEDEDDDEEDGDRAAVDDAAQWEDEEDEEDEEEEEDDDEDGELPRRQQGQQLAPAPLAPPLVIQPAPAPDAPAAGPAQPVDANAAIPQDLMEDLENNVEDDMDGAMEAIGMRGPIYGVMQNVALMIFVLGTAMGVGVWIPFTLGKTTALLALDPPRFLQVLHLPIRAIRVITDPLVDGTVFLIGRLILPPYIRIFSRISSFVGKQALTAIEGVLGKDSAGVATNLFDRAIKFSERPLEILSSIVAPAETTIVDSSLPAPTPIPRELVTNFVEFAEPYFALLGKEVRVAAVRFVGIWETLAVGQGNAEKVFAVGLGYGVIGIILALYLNILTVGNVKSAGRAVRSAVRQQILVLKVAAFIFIELVLFPLGCGAVLDGATVWIFPETSIRSRIMFFNQAPFTALFYHWVAGTMFMYSFAVILSGCRSVLRPGAMWFVKDPQDQNTHPIRDILERPTITQLRKIFVSGILYSFVVLLTVGSIGGLLLMGSMSIAPLRWKTREPLSGVPIDLIFLHLALPYTMHYFRPRKAMKKITTIVWRFLARQFRLTSYFFGERRPSEEFTSKNWIWNPFAEKKPMMLEPHVHDGTFRRVPATDNIALPREMHATAAVTETGEPLNDAAKQLMEKQALEAEKMKRDVTKDYMVVYLPPHFTLRFVALSVCVWILGSFAAGITVALPIQLGRGLFRLFVHEQVHDGYSFLVGFYVLWACYIIGKAVDRLDKRRQRRGGDGPRADLRVLVIKRGLLWIAKISYMILFLGIIIPILVALVMELYVVLPIRYIIDREFVPHIRVVDMWALGLLYAKVGLHVHRRDPDNRISRGIEQIKHNGWTHPDPVAATKEVIGRALVGLLGMIIIPGVLFMGLQYLFPNRLQDRYLFMHVYPSIFAITSTCHSGVLFVEMVRNWSQSVRDKEFLVEMRLRNHEPETKEKAGDTDSSVGGDEILE